MRGPEHLSPYAKYVPMTPTQPQRRRWADCNPRASWITVAWGDTPAYALVARLRADAYAAMNGLIVAERVASYGPDTTTARLQDVAKTCAYVWHAAERWTWWLVSAEHVRLIDADRIKAQQRRAWSQSLAPRPPETPPPAVEPVSYHRVAP